MDLLTNFDPPALAPDAAAELAGAHVRLVPLRRDHADQLQPWIDQREPGLAALLGSPLDYDNSAALFIDALHAKIAGGDVPYAVESTRTGDLLGYTRYLFVEPARRVLHIGGTWYVPPARGTAVNPECKALLLRAAFEHYGFNRVQIQTDVTNARSQRAIVRIGAMFEGVARADHPRRDGTIRDTWIAAITRSDWPAVRAHLERLIAAAHPAP